MDFEIAHEFDIPLDALQLAVVSPELLSRLRPTLGGSVERCEQREHTLLGETLTRAWYFQANIPIPAFAKPHVTREMCAWTQSSVYNLRTHASDWVIRPNIKEEWQKYFQAHGRYELHTLDQGRTRRIVRGSVELRVPVVHAMAERLLVSEVKKNFDAEADTLREMATLA
jgi:Protein of unknown function (DUF2505)